MAFAFTIDPDIARARTLPSSFYLDPAVYALVRERVFARTWQWLGDLDDVAIAGSLSPRELLPGHLAEPELRSDLGVVALGPPEEQHQQWDHDHHDPGAVEELRPDEDGDGDRGHDGADAVDRDP